MKKLVKLLVVMAGASLGFAMARLVIFLVGEYIGKFEWKWMEPLLYVALTLVLGIITFVFSEGIISIVSEAMKRFENHVRTSSRKKLLYEIVGVFIGVIIGYLLSAVISKLGNGFFIFSTSLIIYILAIYACTYMANRLSTDEEEEREFSMPKYLDTNVFIDGRITDVISTGVLDGEIVIPEFILTELQHMADLSDDVKREKGKRGIKVLENLLRQNLKGTTIRIEKAELAGNEDVDTALMRAAEAAGGKIVTLDYNLNRIAGIRGIGVINLNDVSNALKILLVPGDETEITILRQGKERRQGIGYLDDGTMIVIEEGRDRVGEKVHVLITSVLQTSAGRLVFGEIREG